MDFAKIKSYLIIIRSLLFCTVAGLLLSVKKRNKIISLLQKFQGIFARTCLLTICKTVDRPHIN